MVAAGGWWWLLVAGEAAASMVVMDCSPAPCLATFTVPRPWPPLIRQVLDLALCLSHFQLFGLRIGKLFDADEIRDLISTSLPPTFVADEFMEALQAHQSGVLQNVKKAATMLV